jgi:hypothetical protein
MQAARPLPPVFSLLDGLKLINPIRRFKAFAGVTFSPSVYTLEAASDTVRRFGAAIRRNGLQRRPRQAVVRAARVGVRGCRSLADLRHAPAMAADPTELRVRRKAHPPPPTQRALASDARGRRSGRRPCVCLVLSSSADARCAVVSSNATLFPPLEHSAGLTWHRREHAPVCRLSAPLRQAKADVRKGSVVGVGAEECRRGVAPRIAQLGGTAARRRERSRPHGQVLVK